MREQSEEAWMMTDEDMLEAALGLCVEAHRGQRDKAGAPYALHPIRLMMRVTRIEEKVVALLHDVIEDTSVTVQDLRDRGFPEPIIAGVLALTKRDNEPYDAFVARAAENPIAKVVKRADIEDNLDLLRLNGIEERDVARLQKYLSARRMLLEA